MAVRGVVWQSCDLLDPGRRARLVASAGASHLIHLAWYTEPGRYWDASENDDWLAASQSLITRFRDAGGRRVVTAGTCAEYDWRDPSLAVGDCDERETVCRPHSRLGASKLALGRWAAQQDGISAAHGRVFFAYGSDEAPSRLVPSLLLNLLRGEVAETGPGDLVRDFLDGRDIAAALVALCTSDVTGPVNIGSGTGVSIGELARQLAETVGRPELLRIGVRPGRPDEPPRIVARTRRLKDEVGFVPQVGLARGLTDAADWWRQNA